MLFRSANLHEPNPLFRINICNNVALQSGLNNLTAINSPVYKLPDYQIKHSYNTLRIGQCILVLNREQAICSTDLEEYVRLIVHQTKQCLIPLGHTLAINATSLEHKGNVTMTVEIKGANTTLRNGVLFKHSSDITADALSESALFGWAAVYYAMLTRILPENAID